MNKMEDSEVELMEAIARQQDDARHFEEMDEKERTQVAETVDNAVLMEKIADLQKQMAQLKAAPKNQRPGVAKDKNHYKLLTKVLEPWGNVPQQQKDIAKILAGSMELGREYTESEVFAFLVDGAGEFPSITRSKQDVTYLFRYYRGLKKDAKYAGFVARNFLAVI
jgi:hypothetical protein